ncbi:MAG: hypothetical protein JO099_03380 [Acidobacteriia bacterium]|nr:hypothetical protein [Terriglobia bacterium]
MASLDEFVGRIVSRARIPRFSTRDDLERELRAHFEDALEEERGADSRAGDLSDTICRRFGNPEEIGGELERAHRFERRIILTADALLLIGLSVVAVATVILCFQLSIAMSIGIEPSHAFPRLRGQIVGFVSLALGYMSLYLEERVLKRFHAGAAFILNFCGFATLFAVTSSLLHLRTVASGIPFIAGALVRLLQRTSLRPVWCFGTVLPTIAAALNGGRLLSTGGETPTWIGVILRCAGQTAACYLLTLLSQTHERRRSRSAF